MKYLNKNSFFMRAIHEIAHDQLLESRPELLPPTREIISSDLEIVLKK